MIVWHVCSHKKLTKYLRTGHIVPPVRAWETIDDAQRFSLLTGRRLILRLRFPDNAPKLEGHGGRARVMHQSVKVEGI